MQIIDTAIEEVKIVVPQVFGDARGYFFESWSESKYKEAGIDCNWVQDNESKSKFGVLRGLHYQAAPYTQAKLVRVIEGCVLDVAVDIRKGSPTFGKHVAVELSAENKYQLLYPGALLTVLSFFLKVWYLPISAITPTCLPMNGGSPSMILLWESTGK